MKKIMSCLLVLAMMAGCTQQPVKPPIENEPEENETTTPDINQLVQFKMYQHEMSPIQQEEFGVLTIDDLVVEVPIIQIDNDEINDFNSQMLDIYDSYTTNARYTEEVDELGYHRFSFAYTMKSEAFLEDNILSIALYDSSVTWYTNPAEVIVKTYNYSLTENKFISNTELLQYLDLSVEECEQRLSKVLTANYIKDTVLNGEKISEYNPDYEDCIYYDITDDSRIYLDEGIHFVIKGFSGVNKRNYDVKI